MHLEKLNLMKVKNRCFFLIFLLYTLISKALKQSSFREKPFLCISELNMVKFLSWNLLLSIAVRQS